MKWISASGWGFIAYGLSVCGYFSTAVVNRWPAPDMQSGGSSYSSGSSYGRSSGGSWGGGK